MTKKVAIPVFLIIAVAIIGIALISAIGYTVYQGISDSSGEIDDGDTASGEVGTEEDEEDDNEDDLDSTGSDSTTDTTTTDGDSDSGGGGNGDGGSGNNNEEDISCQFNNAFWNPNQTLENNIVELIVEGANCDGESVDFEIQETMGDFVDQLNANFVGDNAAVSWVVPVGVGNSPPLGNILPLIIEFSLIPFVFFAFVMGRKKVKMRSIGIIVLIVVSVIVLITLVQQSYVRLAPGDVIAQYNFTATLVSDPSVTISSDILEVLEVDPEDSDGDGVEGLLDNCPFDYNPDQEDTDLDGIGDVCDVSIDVSQTECVAPCSVHFNALEDFNWEEIEALDFSWDFDSDEQTDLNGYLAAHVFESSGEYNVTLIVSDLEGNEQIGKAFIDVQDPDLFYSGESTICFSTGNDFTSCPIGAQQITSSNWTEIAGFVDSNKRLLFKRGNSWNIEQTSLEDLNSTFIGDFSSGEKPRFSCDGCNPFRIWNSNDGLKILNLAFDGVLSEADGHNALQFKSQLGNVDSSKNILVSGVEVRNFASAFLWDSGNDFGGRTKNIMFKDILIDTTGRYGFGILGQDVENFALIDSTIRNTANINEHAFRSCVGDKILINGVRFEDNQRTNLHIRGGQNWLISESYFGGTPLVDEQGPGTATTLQIRECVEGQGGEVPRVIFERNIVKDQPISNEIGKDVSIRNNLFLHSHGVSIDSTTSDTRVYNNVHYSEDFSGFFIKVFDGASNVGAWNNIYSSQLGVFEFSGNNFPGLNEGSNLFKDNGVIFVNPLDPENGGLALQEGSAGIDEGLSLVGRDYDLTERPQGEAHDIGAYEFVV